MNRTYTRQEMEQLDQAVQNLRDNGFDNLTEDGVQHNADLLDKYFQQNPNVPVTIQNVYKAVEAQKTSFKWLSPSELEYRKIAADNPAAATKLAEWFATQGKPGTLVNAGDDGYQNLTILLAELRGREINATTIQQAIGRIAYNGRRQLHVVKTPRALSQAAQQADHNPGEFISRNGMIKNADGSWRNLNAAEQKAEREAKEAQANPAQAEAAAERQARQEAEGLQGNTHARTNELRRIFVTKPGSSDIDWLATLNSRKQMQEKFERAAAVSFRRY